MRPKVAGSQQEALASIAQLGGRQDEVYPGEFARELGRVLQQQ